MLRVPIRLLHRDGACRAKKTFRSSRRAAAPPVVVVESAQAGVGAMGRNPWRCEPPPVGISSIRRRRTWWPVSLCLLSVGDKW